MKIELIKQTDNDAKSWFIVKTNGFPQGCFSTELEATKLYYDIIDKKKAEIILLTEEIPD